MQMQIIQNYIFENQSKTKFELNVNLESTSSHKKKNLQKSSQL